MTNAEIIFKNSVALAEQGVLRMIQTEAGLMPEPIHTFAAWKEQGYNVKKGEKSNIKFMIWKYVPSKKKTEDEEEAGKMIQKMASFFTINQVEKIGK